MVSKALLQKGEEDEEDASKNPHLSKGERLAIWNFVSSLEEIRTISPHLNCCDGISHWDASPEKDQVAIGLTSHTPKKHLLATIYFNLSLVPS